MTTEDFEQAQALSAQVEQARQRAVLAASDAGASRDDARAAEQQAREYARGVGQVVDGAETARDEAQAAADRAEAPTDAMVATLAGNPVSLTRAAVDQATGDMITTEGSTTQTAGDARWVTNEGADNTVSALLGTDGSETQVADDPLSETTKALRRRITADAEAGVEGLTSRAEKALIFGTRIGNRSINELVAPGSYYEYVPSYITVDNDYPANSIGAFASVDVTRFSDQSLGQVIRYSGSGGSYYRRTTDGGATWSEPSQAPMEKDVVAKIDEYDEVKTYRVDLTDTVNFRAHSSSPLTLCVRRGYAELVGGVVCITAGFASGTTARPFLQLPPEALPAGNTTRRPLGVYGTSTFQLSISPSGVVSVSDHSNTAANAGLWLAHGFNTDWKPITYVQKILGEFIPGVEYQIISAPGTAPGISSIAIHGGETEKGSTELAQRLAELTGAGFYTLDTMKAELHGQTAFQKIHISSNKFDDPAAVQIVGASSRCVSFHNGDARTTGRETPASFVGGRDTDLRVAVAQKLRDAGFQNIFDNPADFPDLSGTLNSNICNQTTRKAGVQIEISNVQMENFFTGGDRSRANRVNRTPDFEAYVQAVLAALVEVGA